MKHLSRILGLAAFVLVASIARDTQAQLISGTIQYTGELGPIRSGRPLCLCVFEDPELTQGLGCLIKFSNPASFSFSGRPDTDYFLVAFVDIHINERIDPDEPFEIYRERGAPPADPVMGGNANVDFVFGDENLPGNASPTPRSTETPTATATVEPTATLAAACGGDCDGLGDVTVDEILTLVNVALGMQPLTACANTDTDHSGSVEVDEIVSAVTHALSGC